MKLTVTSSPHIRGKESTGTIMRDVLIALIPALVAGTVVYGPRALLVTAVCVAACLAAEGLYRALTHQHNTLPDGSAAVTGVLLAMTLPATVPYWLAAVGGVFAIVVVKALCGGIGQNIFNPALAGRALLVLFWPAAMTRFAALGQDLPLLGSAADAVTAATPLHHMQMPALPEASLMDMFLGNVAGCIGEASALALLLGGAYLVVRKVISLRIPAAYLGSVAVLSLLFSKGQDPIQWMLYSIFGGGVMLGAIFMATDYATSPTNPKGQLLYGLGCGVLTVVFRYTGLFPGGVTYAILLMNAAVWAIDRYTAPRRFGVLKGGAA